MTDRQLIDETFSRLHASEDTVTEVLKMAREQDTKKIRRHPARTGALIALAAVLLMGTAFAAVTYHMRTDPVGDFGVAVSVAAEGDVPGAVAFSGEAADVTYKGLDMQAGWLPEGMVNVPGETIKWDWEEDGWRGGFSIGSGPLNAGNATFCDLVTDAESQESLTIQGHEAYYVKMTGDTGFNQRMYISYPEYNAVITVYIGANVDRDTAVKFAENLNVAAGDWEMDAEDLEYNGRRYQDMANYIATGVYVNTADEDVEEEEPLQPGMLKYDIENGYCAQIAAAEDMVNAKAIGESFTLSEIDDRGDGELHFADVTVKVTDIQMAEDTGIFRDPSYLDSDVARLLDENGHIPADTLTYYVMGDGINSPGSTAVAEETQQPKFVAVTVDFTNNTDETIRDIIFHGQLMAVEETENGWAAYVPVPENGVDYDIYSGESWETLMEMRYFDVHDTESNGGNHILDLEPGETVTIQMGFLVNECQADHLWFFFNSGMNDVSTGYVPVPVN